MCYTFDRSYCIRACGEYHPWHRGMYLPRENIHPDNTDTASKPLFRTIVAATYGDEVGTTPTSGMSWERILA
jgi:hypothetical protein